MSTKDNPDPNIPKLKSVKTAVTIYYKNNELGNKEIAELFSCSEGTAWKLKKFAQEYARSKEIMPRCSAYVSTDPAFEAWGLDINKLEYKLKRAEKLGITD